MQRGLGSGTVGVGGSDRGPDSLSHAEGRLHRSHTAPCSRTPRLAATHRCGILPGVRRERPLEGPPPPAPHQSLRRRRRRRRLRPPHRRRRRRPPRPRRGLPPRRPRRRLPRPHRHCRPHRTSRVADGRAPLLPARPRQALAWRSSCSRPTRGASAPTSGRRGSEAAARAPRGAAPTGLLPADPHPRGGRPPPRCPPRRGQRPRKLAPTPRWRRRPMAAAAAAAAAAVAVAVVGAVADSSPERVPGSSRAGRTSFASSPRGGSGWRGTARSGRARRASR